MRADGGQDDVVVLALYAEGIDAVRQAAASFTVDDWARRACGRWDGHQLAGHLLCVVRWYGAWLDRAVRGDGAPPFPASELAAENDRALAALGPGTGPVWLAQFVEEAHRYGDRVQATWDVRYGFPYGTTTAGRHLGVAAGEWHLHAWDLSGGRHAPSDPQALYVAVGRALADARGGPAARFGAWLLPAAARRHAWEQLLRRSGRTPGSPAP